MLITAVLSFVLQFQAADPVRAGEASEKMLKIRPDRQTSIASKPKSGDRVFREKFNALVKAIEAFGKKYNEGKGEVWPKREGDALRKALTELQELPEFAPLEDP